MNKVSYILKKVTHYRLATFVNSTTIAGIKEELTALRLTTVQNRMALDVILAKEGGVCAIVGDTCCTYILANDDDHGDISTALEQMKQVAEQLHLDETSKEGWGWGFFAFYFWCLMDRVWALVDSVREPMYTRLKDAEPDRKLKATSHV